jgi:uncharacterized membrane protein YkvA (DUF1232 family)
MYKKPSGERVKESASFDKATSRANEYANDPDSLNDLLDKAARKADARRGPLAEVRDTLLASFRLLRAYATRKYTRIPWQSLIMLIASVVYFVMPLDLIPDFILSLGIVDDAAILAWTFKKLKGDLDEFRKWESEQTSLGPKPKGKTTA